MLLAALKSYWGYESFRPLQEEAMECALQGRDSVVVLPTGGGKSLCYQAPAVCQDKLAIVVSPLIALMKDQVDSLRSCGIQAAFINSTMTTSEKVNVASDIRANKLRLVYFSPERLVQPKTIEFLHGVDLSFIAIDEAHCISEWGHDFRPEFRQLKILRTEFPNVSMHAFTATATEQVRLDIIRQLNLRDPTVLVGSFDRPNLVYRAERRDDPIKQICEIIERYPRESGIIYCTTRKDTEDISAQLNARAYRTRPYHAGMSDRARQESQEEFIGDKIDIIVATVAFGMGIDKSNVRYVIHLGMPKALENYQQEAGRAGRDGLQSECCLLYSIAEFMRWKKMIETSGASNTVTAMASLQAMNEFAAGVVCRHKRLVEYFGQPFEKTNCQACDVCLGEMDEVENPLIVGQKILSSVVRQGQGRFGGEYTAMVLKGSKDERILRNEHDQLSTYGLLNDQPVQTIREWIDQLATQGFLARVGEYNQLDLTAQGWKLIRGEVSPRLLRTAEAKQRKKKRAEKTAASWDGVDRELFDDLRLLRHELAVEADIPAYVVFTDETLREVARVRPSTLEALRRIRGVGDKKLADYGQLFLDVVIEHGERTGIVLDNWSNSAEATSRPRADYFDDGMA